MSDEPDPGWVIVTCRDDGVYTPAHPIALPHDTALVLSCRLQIAGCVFRVWSTHKWNQYITEQQRC